MYTVWFMNLLFSGRRYNKLRISRRKSVTNPVFVRIIEAQLKFERDFVKFVYL